MSTPPTIIVTGALGNLGQAVVKKFLAEGYKVFGTMAIREKATASLQHTNLKISEVDLLDETGAVAFTQAVIRQEGRVEAAVLTVGGFTTGNIAATLYEDIEKQIRLNLKTAFNVIRPLFIDMLNQGYGRIFLIGAQPGLDMGNGKGMVAYALAKSLVFRLAELMNEEAKGSNVVTAVVVPSTIDTPQNRKAMPDADFNKWVKPEDIASVIHFHCTDVSGGLKDPVIKVFGRS
jgi:NAD(P)-dependent dehydrogenase (short-subunit alcohol dehydrogenase family)